jgi:uncharacterized protein YjiS (DUF1127 family)
MELTFNSHSNAPSGFLVALRHWIRSVQFNRQRRREIKTITQLPDHLLRDIGCEDLIRYRTDHGLYGY